MIRLLVLRNFGKFSDNSFEMGPVSLFWGENEAGKTTLHDALMDALCKPLGNSRQGKRLLARYGKDRHVYAEFDGDAWVIETDAFENLHAENLRPTHGKEIEDLDALENRVERIRADLRSEEDAELRAEQYLGEARESMDDFDARMEQALLRAETARVLRERISAFRTNPPRSSNVVWRGSRLTVGGIGLLVSIGLGLIIQDAIAFVLVIGAAWSVLWIILAKDKTMSIDGKQEESFLHQLRDTWSEETREQIHRDSLDAIEEELATVIGDKEALQRQVEQQKDRIQSLTSERLNHRQNIEEMSLDLNDAETELRVWFTERDLVDRDDFVRKASRREALERELTQINRQLGPRLTEHECESTEELLRECERKLRALDEDGVSRTGGTELEVNIFRQQHDQATRSVEEKKEALRKKQLELNRLEGEVQGSLGGIPENITRLDRTIQRLKSSIGANLLEREAAGLAGEIFAGIFEETDVILEELSKEIADRYQMVVGSNRHARLSSLDKSAITLTDAGGKERPLESVSGGTRDAFMLAARLTMAQRGVEEESVLVLDEPFQGFDERRLARAVMMLMNFRESTGWQIIVLTKDRLLVDLSFV